MDLGAFIHRLDPASDAVSYNALTSILSMAMAFVEAPDKMRAAQAQFAAAFQRLNDAVIEPYAAAAAADGPAQEKPDSLFAKLDAAIAAEDHLTVNMITRALGRWRAHYQDVGALAEAQNIIELIMNHPAIRVSFTALGDVVASLYRAKQYRSITNLWMAKRALVVGALTEPRNYAEGLRAVMVLQQFAVALEELSPSAEILPYNVLRSVEEGTLPVPRFITRYATENRMRLAMLRSGGHRREWVKRGRR